jgi:hypothetical protein
LLALVAEHGMKSWMKVSAVIGNRSDIQCRYRYLQILRGKSGVGGEEEKEGEEMRQGCGIDEGDSKRGVFEFRELELDLGANSMSEIFWMLHS